jgi:hypothetical protein
MKKCSYDGCDKPLRALGLCNQHWKQQASGQQLRPLFRSMTFEERFRSRLKTMPSGCIEWTGARSGGYGMVKFLGRSVLAHRVAFGLAGGLLNDAVLVLHSCDNPPCCNPAHLRSGTSEDNASDRESRKRRRIIRGSVHGMSKLTEDNVNEIRLSSEKSTVVAAKFRVSPSTICLIKKRKIWAHI